MKNSDKLIDVEGADLFPEHFSVDANRYIIMAMLYLKSKGIPPTPMAIMEVLPGDNSRKEVEELGGLDYLLTIQDSHVPADNLKIFIEKIKQSYTRRMLYRVAQETMAFVTSNKAEVLNPHELTQFAEQKIIDINVGSNTAEEIYKMGDDTERILKERAENPESVPGLEVGWEEFDRVTQGGQPGDLIIVCAPSKTGKSVTLTNWATKLGIRDQLPVLYIDTEMNSREQEDRVLANLSGIPQAEIASGLYVMDTVNGTAEEKVAKLDEARKKLNLGNYYHIYMPQFTIESVTALVRQFQLQHGIVALFFDYIKIPSNDADFKSAQEYQRLGFFTSGLKDLAGIMGIPVYSAAQTNRSDSSTDSPDESNIGGSYRILQLASKLMFLYNKTEEQIARDGFGSGNQLLHIKWQRNGESDCDPIHIAFDKPILRQQEA